MTRDELIEMHAKTDAMERVNMRVRIDTLERALAGIVNHWREFGEMMINNQDDYGLDERMDAAATLIPDRVA